MSDSFNFNSSGDSIFISLAISFQISKMRQIFPAQLKTHGIVLVADYPCVSFGQFAVEANFGFFELPEPLCDSTVADYKWDYAAQVAFSFLFTRIALVQFTKTAFLFSECVDDHNTQFFPFVTALTILMRFDRAIDGLVAEMNPEKIKYFVPFHKDHLLSFNLIISLPCGVTVRNAAKKEVHRMVLFIF
ncbi:hypothetical protein A2Z53_00010 [Candidatus Giovannonibacteria bacterium RIFCSPHIGHO2_02_42_15]|uniref:Uncharacterized protein n=1 Tax=Candidatus Giovannonibacteria bacterium RIFCSPHIGHO2_02_42_15 TaxID=1798329 RepID=A0A1F5VM11_9BACT|nr:MAG: hypothetical protein A2Z53_00010 [Candidatus Giovannonibacteria bacterium RIFCSPHIGHO2_02_42_15]